MNKNEKSTLFSIAKPLDKLYVMMENVDKYWNDVFTDIENYKKYKAYKKIIYKHLDQIQLIMDTLLGTL